MFCCAALIHELAAAALSPAAVANAVNPTITATTVVSRFTHTDLAVVGQIDFNLPLLNTLQRMTQYTSYSNLMDHPTDCPTRERAGWTGDGQLTAPVVSLNFDSAAFYRKWLRDIGDSQRFFRVQCMRGTVPPAIQSDCDCSFYNCTGEVPPAAPWYLHGYHGGTDTHNRHDNLTYPGTDPAWGMAYVVVSHHLLEWYGDLEAVEAQYTGLVLYMDYLRRLPGVNPSVPPFETSGLLTYNLFSDWDRPVISGAVNPPVPPSRTVPPATAGPRGVPSPLIGSWVYLTELRLMVEIATALGHTDDAARFAADAARAASAFVGAYFRGPSGRGGTFGDGSLTQTAANALALDLFPKEAGVDGHEGPLSPEQRQAAVSALVDAVMAAGNHSDVGIISYSALFPVLSAAAAPPDTQVQPNVLALEINLKRDYPSFGDELAQNATTLWENFDGTGTHNHIMFGTQSVWYYRHLAGIQTQTVNRTTTKGPAWQALRLKPAVSCDYLRADLNLTAVNATYASSRGVIGSAWRLWQCPGVPSPPPAAVTCAVAFERDGKHHPNVSGVVELSCGPAGTITSVPFAAFGNPTGNCTVGFGQGNCSATGAVAAVAALCVGHQRCRVPVSVTTFGDPCIGVPKQLAVNITCQLTPTPPPSPPPAIGPRKFTWVVSIPTTATAIVEVPLLGAEADRVTITVDGEPVWRGGAFVPGVGGVSSAAATLSTVAFVTGSGQYGFLLADAGHPE